MDLNQLFGFIMICLYIVKMYDAVFHVQRLNVLILNITKLEVGTNLFQIDLLPTLLTNSSFIILKATI